MPLVDEMTEGIVFAHDLGDWMIHTAHDHQAACAKLLEG